MTYGDALKYIVDSGNVHRAIMDLSWYANKLMCDMQKDISELKAEKRTVQKFLASDLVLDQKIVAIGSLLAEETT